MNWIWLVAIGGVLAVALSATLPKRNRTATRVRAQSSGDRSGWPAYFGFDSGGHSGGGSDCGGGGGWGGDGGGGGGGGDGGGGC